GDREALLLMKLVVWVGRGEAVDAAEHDESTGGHALAHVRTEESQAALNRVGGSDRAVEHGGLCTAHEAQPYPRGDDVRCHLRVKAGARPAQRCQWAMAVGMVLRRDVDGPVSYQQSKQGQDEHHE